MYTITPTRITINEPIDVWLTAERDEADEERWVIYCHKVTCGTTFVYPDDSFEDEPQEVGDIETHRVAAEIGDTAAYDMTWEDLAPADRDTILRLWNEDE